MTHRVRVLTVVFGIAVALAALPQGASATGGPWEQLEITILSTVPPGPAQVALLAAADQIEYMDSHGTWQDLLQAYNAFVDLVAGHFAGGTLTQAHADIVLGCLQDVSEDKKVEVIQDFRLAITLFKNCDFADCTIEGTVCISFKWKYKDEQGNTGGGQNCFGR